MSALLPLHGVTVLDLSRVLAGPYATQIFGDLGATVWKVEHPTRGDDTRAWGPIELEGESAYFLSVNRNKRSLGVDLKSDEGKALIKRLAAKADVVFENFPPGKLEALGLGFDVLREQNPKLVMTSVTAFGRVGPLSSEPGYDLVVQGYGGIMALTGPEDGAPHRVGVPIVDLTTGLNAVIGTLAALRTAERDGVGQHVDVSLFDTHLAWLGNVGSNALISGQPSPRLGNAHPNVAPYQPYPCADGWILLAVGNDGQFERLLGLEDFASLRPANGGSAEWATNNGRVTDRVVLAEKLNAVFGQRNRDDWMTMLKEVRVPCGPILRPDEALAHPQTSAAGMLATMTHATAGPFQAVASPYHLDRTPVTEYSAPPTLGADTDGVLGEALGMSADEVAQLRAAGVVK
ncbi:MAG: CoA transferase [Deltaproteobacteria bacterium]|nr:CoA transferase [Deltaproteobacteria bacterium]